MTFSPKMNDTDNIRTRLSFLVYTGGRGSGDRSTVRADIQSFNTSTEHLLCPRYCTNIQETGEARYTSVEHLSWPDIARCKTPNSILKTLKQRVEPGLSMHSKTLSQKQ